MTALTIIIVATVAAFILGLATGELGLWIRGRMLKLSRKSIKVCRGSEGRKHGN